MALCYMVLLRYSFETSTKKRLAKNFLPISIGYFISERSVNEMSVLYFFPKKDIVICIEALS